MTRVVTLVPWRPSDDRREQLWRWTRPHLDALGWPIVTGDSPGEVFSLSSARNAAARAAGEWDVALVADADTIPELEPLRNAVTVAMDAGFAIPWTVRFKLNRAGTMKIVKHGPPVNDKRYCDRYDPTSMTDGGGLVMVTRSAWERVGGWDETFQGYGDEDLAFQMAMETLVIKGPTPRVTGRIWHLWHEPVSGVGTPDAAAPENHARWARYVAAVDDPEAMEALVSGR